MIRRIVKIMKTTVKLIKYFIITLLFLIPLIKFFLDVQFGITLMNTAEVIGTYILVYSILGILAVLMVRKVSFGIVMFVFLSIYAFTLYLGNGLDSKLSTLNEYTSPNNSNILIVNTHITRYPSGYIKFSKKISPFLQKSIRTPKLEGYLKNNNLNYTVSWKDDNTAIITGRVVVKNTTKFNKVKERLPDECDYEIIDESLYLNLK